MHAFGSSLSFPLSFSIFHLVHSATKCKSKSYEISLKSFIRLSTGTSTPLQNGDNTHKKKLLQWLFNCVYLFSSKTVVTACVAITLSLFLDHSVPLCVSLSLSLLITHTFDRCSAQLFLGSYRVVIMLGNASANTGVVQLCTKISTCNGADTMQRVYLLKQ